MTSILKVTEIQDPTNGNSALTIDSDGYVIAAKKPYVSADISQTTGTNVYVSVAANTAIPFGTVYDGDSALLDTSSYKFQCPVDGIYMLSYATHTNTTGTQNNVMRNRDILNTCYESDVNTLTNSIVVRCDAGDELWIRNFNAAKTYYNGGGNSLSTVQRYTYAHFALIG